MRWILAACLFVLSSSVTAQTQPVGLTDHQKQEVVRAAATAYADYYVFADKGRSIAKRLHERLAASAFGETRDGEAFAAALTRTIQEASPDRHIRIVYENAAPAPVRGAAPASRARQFGWVEPLRRRNYDFVRVERLPGNVGYLRLDSFPPPELAEPTATAAMAFLKNSDALIVDLRENGGGTGDMVRFLASYFFVEPTRLSRVFRRDRVPQVSYEMTLSSIPGAGERMPIADVFVLTSNRTISAAEAFAFALQQRGRATIVGEITAGAGNAGEYVDLGHGFRAFVPDVHVSSPVSDASWEGAGVKPDIRTPAGQALIAAHREAVQRLLAAATDQGARDALHKALRTPPN